MLLDTKQNSITSCFCDFRTGEHCAAPQVGWSELSWNSQRGYLKLYNSAACTKCEGLVLYTKHIFEAAFKRAGTEGDAPRRLHLSVTSTRALL
jgi:hypothetical protein